VEAGSYDTASLSYGLTQKTDKMEASLTLTHLQTRGFSAVTGGTEADGGDATRLAFSTRYAVSGAVTVGMSAFSQHTKQDFDGYDPDTFALVEQNTAQDRRETGGRVYREGTRTMCSRRPLTRLLGITTKMAT
jgi:vitamin B12 transporter